MKVQKGCILLTTASSSDDALDQAKNFLATRMDWNNYFWESYELGGSFDSLLEHGSSCCCKPLAQCLEMVKEWVVDMESWAEETWKEMLEVKEKNSSFSAAGLAKTYAKIIEDDFWIGSRVFDLVEHTNRISLEKADIDSWYAIVVEFKV
jgi:hypothetical protein